MQLGGPERTVQHRTNVRKCTQKLYVLTKFPSNQATETRRGGAENGKRLKTARLNSYICSAAFSNIISHRVGLCDLILYDSGTRRAGSSRRVNGAAHGWKLERNCCSRRGSCREACNKTGMLHGRMSRNSHAREWKRESGVQENT